MPEPDEKMQKCIKTQRMKPKEVAKIYKTFQKHDKARTGVINFNAFLKTIEEQRTFYTDAILDCFDISMDENGCIDFSDYLVFVVSFCMFEPPEIQKLCFYIFDDDKGGTIDADELKMLMNTLYNVKVTPHSRPPHSLVLALTLLCEHTHPTQFLGPQHGHGQCQGFVDEAGVQHGHEGRLRGV